MDPKLDASEESDAHLITETSFITQLFIGGELSWNASFLMNSHEFSKY